jgi:SAM-dependent methyltransferase
MYLGIKLGFFKGLAEAGPRGLTATALAERCGTVPNYTMRWCQTATALELVDVMGSGRQSTRNSELRYRLATGMDELFANEGGAFYLGGSPNVQLQIARDYKRFLDFFKNGGTYPFQSHDRPFFLALTKGPRPQPRLFINVVLPKVPGLKQKLEQGAKILDLGCGGGHALVEFAKTFPKSECVGVDIIPYSVKSARRLIANNGVQGRAAAHLVEPGADLASRGPFDLVTLFLVLHEISPTIKEETLRKVVKTLKPGGYLMIYDEAFPATVAELRSEPEVFGVIAQWFESSWGNVLNTRSEIRQMVSELGLKLVNETNYSRYYIATTQKP